jgi:NADPH:quinone reductase-like Zn-dependent oxidoreductase
METIPSFQTAVVGLPDGELGISDRVPLPDPEDDMIMVKNVAVGLNPVDTKMTGQLSTPGAISGMDFAGVVLAVGSKVSSAAPIAVGDRVCGAVQGMHSLTPRVGAFAHYIGATDHVTLKLPDTMSFEEGAALGSGISTIGLALFRSLQVPGYPLEPAEKPRHVLVYGGSTATGTLAIQLLKLCVASNTCLASEMWDANITRLLQVGTKTNSHLFAAKFRARALLWCRGRVRLPVADMHGGH